MTFISALLLGLFASVHCAGMCGGLQVVFNHSSVIRTESQNRLHLLLLNTGRVLTYIVLGVLLSYIGSKIVLQLNLPFISRVLRLMIALVLILIGLQLLLSDRKPFAVLEKWGYQLWSKLQPKINKDDASAKLSRSLRMGLLWGLLPCGLVYSVLITAALSGSVVNGGLIMFGFGLGTLPAMILTGGALVHFRAWLKRDSTQMAGGLLFFAAGCVMIIAPYILPHSLIEKYPVLLNTVFCFT